MMDHGYIDDNSIAERYLRHALPAPERRNFEQHLVDCQECSDRLLLAEMFLSRNGSAHGRSVPLPIEQPTSAAKIGPSQPLPAAILPLRARIAAALSPWQLFLLFVITAVLLLAIPTTGILLTERYYTGNGTRSIDTRR